MGKVERRWDSATCGHKNTGSPDVFVNNKACTRVFADFAGGKILGPGVKSVRVNGYPISIRGDKVAWHGDGVHSNAKTSNPSEDVIAGTI